MSMVGSGSRAARICVGVLAVAAGLLANTPALAAPPPAVCTTSADGSGCVTPNTGNADFGFVDTTGATPLAVGASVTATQLQGYGVDLAVVGRYANGAQPVYGAGTRSTAADPVAEEDATTTSDGVTFGSGTATQKETGAAPSTSALASAGASGATSLTTSATRSSVNDILWHWGDKSNLMVIYRRGYYIAPSRGWGDAKIQGKHNMNYKTAWATTRYPQPGYPISAGGTSKEYRTPVYHVKCSGWWIFRTCKVVETVTSRAVVDYRRLSDGWAFGVVTNYAIGYVRAPDWVKNAINI